MLGQALDRRPRRPRRHPRFGDARAPLDEALAHAVVDLGGRGFARDRAAVRERPHRRLCRRARAALLRQPLPARPHRHPLSGAGDDDHHLLEAAFKALALALRQAVGAAIRAGPGRCRARRAACDRRLRRRLRRRQPAQPAHRPSSGRARRDHHRGRRPRERSRPACSSPASAPRAPRWQRSSDAACRRAIRAAAGRGAHVLGICLGLQLLFDRATRATSSASASCPAGSAASMGFADRLPHMGWNDVAADATHPLAAQPAGGLLLRPLLRRRAGRPPPTWSPRPSSTATGSRRGADRGASPATQFHPEKSGAGGPGAAALVPALERRCCVGAIIPCLDVRAAAGWSRACGSVTCATAATPSVAAERYAAAGADEIVWLNIDAACRGLAELLRAVERAAERVDVPLCVGGGIDRSERARDLLLAGADKIRSTPPRSTGRSWSRSWPTSWARSASSSRRRGARKRQLGGARLGRDAPHGPRRDRVVARGGRARRRRAPGDEHRRRRRPAGYDLELIGHPRPSRARARHRLGRGRRPGRHGGRAAAPARRRRWPRRSSTTARRPWPT